MSVRFPSAAGLPHNGDVGPLSGDGTSGARSRFESVGRQLPEKRQTTRELMATCRHNPRIPLQMLTGIHERRVCEADEDAAWLAIGAARDCLDHSIYGPDDLDVIINCSISRFGTDLSYAYEPTLSQVVARAVGARNAMCFDLTNACAGMLTGVITLDALIRAGTARRGLIVSGEFITHIARTAAAEVRNIQDGEVASLTVGDAGVAVVMDQAPQQAAAIEAWEFLTVAEHSDLCVAAPYRSGPGAAMSTKALALETAALQSCPALIGRVTAACGLPLDEVCIIPHQTAERAIQAGVAHLIPDLGGRPQNVVSNVRYYGNTASTTHFLALYELLTTNRLQPGQRIAMIVHASGLVVGAVAFTVDALVEKYGHSHPDN